ncbi:hypothetical protein [Peptoniphilus indolicus]|uniref:Uncharacterized protein n=2 Tax=Peptoniphilus indolicus TaxID=33030 RepID=G4D0W9_9FIRM|nr:hypothetical protein [Peptoniphilus indolicus]EGY80865.1 hypothetical protein HMPREF9129_0049 [Peptoniphilus indolicus ATCC 29427]SUB74745.1 Uncharacterised protein [Peptoniphilus indolicus]
MKVGKKSLVLWAAIVWVIAGVNVLKIGISVYSEYLSLLNLGLSVIVFLIFGI